MKASWARVAKSASDLPSRISGNAVASHQPVNSRTISSRPLHRLQCDSGEYKAAFLGRIPCKSSWGRHLGAFERVKPLEYAVTLPTDKGALKRLLHGCRFASAMSTEAASADSRSRDEKLGIPYKVLTLVIIQQNGRVLLGKKKRGFGEGYYNGFGGKVEKGETVEEAAARELQEESGVTAVNMQKRGILIFHFDDNPQPWQVHVFHAGEFVGEPYETDEMAPTWFSIEDIPYDNMWADDPLWYPEFLKGNYFTGEFYFKETHVMQSHNLRVVDSL